MAEAGVSSGGWRVAGEETAFVKWGTCILTQKAPLGVPAGPLHSEAEVRADLSAGVHPKTTETPRKLRREPLSPTSVGERGAAFTWLRKTQPLQESANPHSVLAIYACVTRCHRNAEKSHTSAAVTTAEGWSHAVTKPETWLVCV